VDAHDHARFSCARIHRLLLENRFPSATAMEMLHGRNRRKKYSLDASVLVFEAPGVEQTKQDAIVSELVVVRPRILRRMLSE
jgi:hypothetical protein